MSIETPAFVPVSSEPVFTVLGMEAVPGALTPTLRFELHVTEPEGLEIHTIALTTQVQVEPAKRVYDPATRERLEELFGAPERWGATTQNFQWAAVSALVPGFTGSTTFHIEVPCTYDLEIAATKYFYGLSGGEVPLAFHFTGMVLYAGEHDRLQVRPVPWSCSARWRMPIAAFKAAMVACYPGGGWVRLSPETLDALHRRRAADGHHSFDALVADLLEDRGMTRLEELVDTLLWEGYALYPYTPGAAKNATPTPFGIVYPPVYAAGSPTTFDRIQMMGVLSADEDATVQLTVRFLEPTGERHEGAARCVELPGISLRAFAEGALVECTFAYDCVEGRVSLSTQTLIDGMTRVCATVENTTPVPEGLDRSGALRHSLLSTHLIATTAGGRFYSPISPPEDAAMAVMTSACINTYPVLATPEDDVLLGAAIILPDHPQIAPESRGDLFDGTEIEEALLLHMLVLTDEERASIELQDPAVRAMLERAIRTTPEEFEKLRGRITISDPPEEEEVKGEERIVVDGVTYVRGSQVRLAPEPGRNAQDHLLVGRTATIERILLDYAEGIHLCVTVDDDPGQDLMRDIGRYLYFKPTEVEVL